MFGCIHNVCSFDECLTDTDCPTGEACGCADEQSGNGENFNRCFPANCRTDADCGSGYTCSPSRSGSCGYLQGYQCHTAGDTCTTDADCCNPATPQCQYQPTLGHFACQAAMVCNG